MDDGGHRENGRHKPDHYKAAQSQWMMQHQPSMKQIMAIMAERDGAIHERNLALSEKKAAMVERDMAFHQRDLAIAERNNALMERDNIIATLQYRDNTAFTTNNNNISLCPPSCQISRGVKHMHHPQQHQLHHVLDMSETMSETPYGTREMHPSNNSIPVSPVASDTPKPRQLKQRQKETKKPSKPSKKPKRGSEEDGLKPDWKGQDLGLNQVAFDDSTMAPPVCSCTGVARQCYKWGSGGWQSSCCTTTVSMYPLPAVPNKRHARVGGRKMSGGAFSKLLSRLAAEGHDLSNPVDLKDNWAKHGTNRYITIK